MKGILDFFLVEKGTPSIDESQELVNKAANSIKYLPQLVSVITICIATLGLILNLAGIEDATLKIVVQWIVGIITFIFGFKLEKSIEAFFCHPIRLIRDGKHKDRKYIGTIISTSFLFVVLLCFSFMVTKKGKEVAIKTNFKTIRTDFSNLLKEASASLGISGNTSDTETKVSDCQKEITTYYDALISEKDSLAKTMNGKDRNHIENTVIKRLRGEKNKMLKSCSDGYSKEFEAKKEGLKTVNTLVSTIIDKQSESDKETNENIKELQNLYSNFTDWIIYICVPLSLLLYIVKVLNEKK